MNQLIDVQPYGISPGDNRLNSYHLRRLLDSLRGQEGVVLQFGPGDYHFYPDFAREETLYISNHDEDSPKRLIFDLHGFRNLTLEGGGARFIFHPQCLPFYLDHTQGLVLRDFSLDYTRTSFSQGTILSIEPKRMRLAIDPVAYPHFVKNGQIFFTDEHFCNPLNNFLEFDAVRLAPVSGIHDLNLDPAFSPYHLVAEAETDGVVALTLVNDTCFPAVSRTGNIVVLRHNPRNNPGFYLTFARDFTLEDVTVHTAAGIAFMAEHSGDITLRRFALRLPPGKGRVVTAEADATHFVCCFGTIELDQCFFENQLDDPSNIHGIYVRVAHVLAPDQIIVELVHPQHKGVPMFATGDRLSLVDSKSLQALHEVLVRDCEFLNGDLQVVTLAAPLAADLLASVVGQAAENLSYSPDVHIHDCMFQNNRARGLLLTSAGKVVIERNHFRVPGAAILLEGDASSWYESGATKDIQILDNTFTDCGDVPVWGKAVIQSTPSVARDLPPQSYHQKLTVKGNTFTRCSQIFHLEHVGIFIEQNNAIL